MLFNTTFKISYPGLHTIFVWQRSLKKKHAIYYLIVAMKIRIIMNDFCIENHIAVAISDQITAVRFFFSKLCSPK